MMNRQDLALLMLAQGRGRPFSPVQIQKALFLVTRNLPGILTEGTPYIFESYAYGPFDKAIYDDLRALARVGHVEPVSGPNGRWREYRATPQGVAASENIAKRADPHDLRYIQEVARFVLPLSFAQLVAAIYKAYPEMAENSVFVGRS